MLVNDGKLCLGALMCVDEIQYVHQQCEDCYRRTGNLFTPNPPTVSWIKPPLGLLADPDELCEMRISV